MDALGIERAAVVGNSMGGATAIRLAAEHPARVSHLITMGAPVNRGPRLFGPGDGPSEGLKILIEERGRGCIGQRSGSVPDAPNYQIPGRERNRTRGASKKGTNCRNSGSQDARLHEALPRSGLMVVD